MKRALLVSPYFIPSNFAGIHRVRVMAGHLEEFGWKPIIVTVRPEDYEDSVDGDSYKLLRPGLRVERVSALPTKICRPFGFGDVALRAQWSLRRKIAQLVRGGEGDLIFVTVLPGYSSLLGAWAKRRFNLPFVLDYQDPWVSDWGAAQPRWSKAGLAHQTARWFEPKVVATVDAMTTVSDQTLDTLRARKLLPATVPLEIIPIGADQRDHEVAERYGQSAIRRETETFHIAYLGTVTDRMLPALKGLLTAVAQVSGQQSRKIAVHFIGTSGQSGGEDPHNLRAIVERLGLCDSIEIRPSRIGYLDALRTMQDADLLLLIGSTDSHYTASKLFPYWLAKRPIVGLFHSESTVYEIARKLGGIRLINYDTHDEIRAADKEVARVLHEVIDQPKNALPPRNVAAFEPYSARGVAAAFARTFDMVLA